MNLEDVLLQGLRSAQPAPTDVGEGTLYFVTDEDLIEQSLGSIWTAYSATGSGITQLTGAVTAGPGSGSVAATIATNAVTTAKILDANVTLAKIVNVSAASRLLGRGSAGGAGVPQEVSIGTGLSMSGTTLSATGGGSPAVAIAQASQPGTLNLTTEGTLDWLYINGSTTTPRTLGGSSIFPNKIRGGELLLGFDWVLPGTLFTQNDSMAASSSAGDSCHGAALSSVVSSQGIFTGGADTNLGWRLIIPASINATRTLKIYCSVFSGIVTVTARLPYENLSDSLTFDSTAASVLSRMITITFNGGGVLTVTGLLTTNHGSSPNMKFQCATLA